MRKREIFRMWTREKMNCERKTAAAGSGRRRWRGSLFPLHHLPALVYLTFGEQFRSFSPSYNIIILSAWTFERIAIYPSFILISIPSMFNTYSANIVLHVVCPSSVLIIIEFRYFSCFEIFKSFPSKNNWRQRVFSVRAILYLTRYTLKIE